MRGDLCILSVLATNSPMKNTRYTVVSFTIQDGSPVFDDQADTLAEAKRKARYFLSEAFRVSGEMTYRAGYARVENEQGECVFDCFNSLGLAPTMITLVP